MRSLVFSAVPLSEGVGGVSEGGESFEGGRGSPFFLLTKSCKLAKKYAEKHIFS